MPSPDDVAAVHIEAPDIAAATQDETPGNAPVTADEPTPQAFVLLVLAAVVDMALRSKRRQADLEAALRRAGIEATRERVLEAVDRLCAEGWVDNVVELHDGGMLLAVTTPGLEMVSYRRVG
jgi:hypothetical protein